MHFSEDAGIEEQIVGRRRVFDGLILHIDHADVRLPNGKTAKREIACHIGASAVLPVDADGTVTLVRQYRTPVGRPLLEIPAGKLDAPDEDRLAAAKRELLEETGLIAKEWIHLVDMASTPGFSSEIISLYLARDLSRRQAQPDEDEFLNVMRIPFSRAEAMALAGELEDAKTICAILMAGQYLGGGNT